LILVYFPFYFILLYFIIFYYFILFYFYFTIILSFLTGNKQACCGISEEDIVQNYAESELYLSSVLPHIQQENEERGLDQNFDGTPAQVMHETLEFLRDKWDSVNIYLDSIGFSYAEQVKLAQVLKRFDHTLSIEGDLSGGDDSGTEASSAP
jgi:hypothetical protein